MAASTGFFKTKSFYDCDQEKLILSGLNKQRLSGTLCDVILRVSGESIRVHSNVMSAASVYFFSVLGVKDDQTGVYTPDSESPQVITPQVIEINIDTVDDSERGIYFEVMQNLVNFIYTGTIVLTDRILSQTLQLAKLLTIDRAIDFCENFISSHGIINNIPSDVPANMENVVTPQYEEGYNQDVIIMDDEVNVFKCSNCSFIAQSKHQLETHALRCHIDVEKSNDIDSRVENNEILSDEIGNDKSAECRMKAQTTYKCKMCDFTGHSKRQIRTHRHSYHIAKMINDHVCVFCKLKLSTKEEYDEHCKLHYKPYPYFCTFCDKRFKMYSELKGHLVRHSTERPYMCQLCYKSFKRKKGYEMHVEAHKKKQFVRQFGFKRRRKCQLDGYEPILCTTCGELCPTFLSYQQHVSNHEKERKYACHVCSFYASQKDAITEHLLTQHQIGRVTKSPEKSNIKNLAKNRAASQNQRLKRLNELREEFQCLICEKKFVAKNILARHMTVHSESRPFECSMCDFTTKRRDTLKDHVWYMHKKVLPPAAKKPKKGGGKFHMTESLVGVGQEARQEIYFEVIQG